MRQLLLIAGKEFSDRLRNGWVLISVLVWLGAIGLTSLFGLLQIGRIGVQGYDRTVVSLLSLVQYLVPLLGLLLGHDLVVSEREDRTLALVFAGGVRRTRLLLGKFLGGALALSLPVVLGFAIAGCIIGLAAEHQGFGSFVKLAASGLVLGLVFLGIGLLVSVLSRTRVQALVMALLAWCAAVFAFDLVAMGLLVVTRSSQATREVELASDATHVRKVEDIHNAFEAGDDAAARHAAVRPTQSPLWLLINPVDLFRAVNLPRELAVPAPAPAAAGSVLAWLAGSLMLASWQLKRIDL